MLRKMVASVKPVRALRNYINGEFVEGGNGVIQSINPATGEHIADIPKSGKDEVNAGVYHHSQPAAHCELAKRYDFYLRQQET